MLQINQIHKENDKCETVPQINTIQKTDSHVADMPSQQFNCAKHFFPFSDHEDSLKQI